MKDSALEHLKEALTEEDSAMYDIDPNDEDRFVIKNIESLDNGIIEVTYEPLPNGVDKIGEFLDG